MAFPFRACKGRISSIPILHCTKSGPRLYCRHRIRDDPARNQAPYRRQKTGGRIGRTPGMMPQDPTLRQRGSNRNSERRTPPPSVPPIRLATLLLPVANHQYDARWTSSPSGRYCFPQAPIPIFFICLATRPTYAGDAWVPFRPDAGARRRPALQDSHRSGDALLLPAFPEQDWQPLLLPSCQSISATPAGFPPPAGVCFSGPSQPSMHNWP